jgi:hypothetical protein
VAPLHISHCHVYPCGRGLITNVSSTAVAGQNRDPHHLRQMKGTSTYTSPPQIRFSRAAALLAYMCFLCDLYKENNNSAPSAHPTGALRAPVVVVVFVCHTGKRHAPNMGICQRICCPGGANVGWWCIDSGPPTCGSSKVVQELVHRLVLQLDREHYDCNLQY